MAGFHASEFRTIIFSNKWFDKHERLRDSKKKDDFFLSIYYYAIWHQIVTRDSYKKKSSFFVLVFSCMNRNSKKHTEHAFQCGHIHSFELYVFISIWQQTVMMYESEWERGRGGEREQVTRRYILVSVWMYVFVCICRFETEPSLDNEQVKWTSIWMA